MPETCRSAREDLEFLQEGKGQQAFFPLDRLRHFFTYDKIKNILECTCVPCQRQIHSFQGRHSPENYTTTIRGGERTAGPKYYAVLGLLLCIEHPMLIIGFANSRFDDEFLERWTTDPTLFSLDRLRRCTGQYAVTESKRFELFISKFSDHIPQFAIPHLSESFEQYHSEVRLPFIQEKEIGKRLDQEGNSTNEGANGRVFRFKLYAEYHKLSDNSNRELARKQIGTPQPQAFLERSNIEFVQKFRHKNIVQLYKVYGRGETINLIMPKARTNLYQLLRNQVLGYGTLRGPKIENSDAWNQILGVADAIKQFQGFPDGPSISDSRSDSCLSGIHFDLKPDNILVDESGVWLITDFGQAAVTERRPGMSPRVGDHFGTDAYAPPEIEDANVAFGRKYDIWSLGCIILEVTAFLVCGYPGLVGAEGYIGLDEARKAKQSWTRISDERFFYEQTQNGPWIVKSEITDFAVDLERRHAVARDRSEESKTFLCGIMDLIRRMLKIEVNNRPNMSRVIDLLSNTLTLALASSDPSRNTTALDPYHSTYDHDSTSGLEQMKVLHWSENRRSWENSSLLVVKKIPNIMQLHCQSRGRDTIPVEFDFTSVKILPSYAFWDPKELAESETWLSLAYFNKTTLSPVARSWFSFDGDAGLQEARSVQAKLMAQEIIGSFDLDSVFLLKADSTRGALSRLRQMVINKDDPSQFDGNTRSMAFDSATLQIWRECCDSIQEQVGRSNTSISERQARYWDKDKHKIPTCRIAIHVHRQQVICTIRIDANWVIKSDGNDSQELCFKPHPSISKVPFYASWIRPTPQEQADHHPAGIPLSLDALRYVEDSETIGVTEIRIRFSQAREKANFEKRYQSVKATWAKSREQLGTLLAVNRMPESGPSMPPGSNVPVMPETKAVFHPTPSATSTVRNSSSSFETKSSPGSTTGISTTIAYDPAHLAPPIERTRRRPFNFGYTRSGATG
ncbi:hypothetical protein ACN47E_004185 [Coniothyrium glycines]